MSPGTERSHNRMSDTKEQVLSPGAVERLFASPESESIPTSFCTQPEQQGRCFDVLGTAGSGGESASMYRVQERKKYEHETECGPVQVVKMIALEDKEYRHQQLGLSDRFQKQIGVHTHSTLEASHIVPVLDRFSMYLPDGTEGIGFLMPYMKDGDLRDLLNKSFEGIEGHEEDMASLTLQVGVHTAMALEHIHALGYVHGDVKPENIFVNASNGAFSSRLADFGVARVYDMEKVEQEKNWHSDELQYAAKQRTSSHEEISGTLAYMAPEAFTDKIPEPSDDLYALGVLLYNLRTNRIPIKASKHTSAFQYGLMKHQIDPTPIATYTDVDTPFDDLIMTLIAREKIKRSSVVIDGFDTPFPLETAEDVRVCMQAIAKRDGVSDILVLGESGQILPDDIHE